MATILAIASCVKDKERRQERTEIYRNIDINIVILNIIYLIMG